MLREIVTGEQAVSEGDHELRVLGWRNGHGGHRRGGRGPVSRGILLRRFLRTAEYQLDKQQRRSILQQPARQGIPFLHACTGRSRSEEHTSELQSLMRISYAVFCLKKKKNQNTIQ